MVGLLRPNYQLGHTIQIGKINLSVALFAKRCGASIEFIRILKYTIERCGAGFKFIRILKKKIYD